MILVTGATGTIGSEVVRQLAARGEKVRALTRDPAAARVPSGVETAPGHHRDRASVEAAMAGAEAAFLVGVFGPDDAEYDRGLVEAAMAAGGTPSGGVRRIVKLSTIGTGDPRLGRFGTWHRPGEEATRASGLEWTILRPSSFASNTLAWSEAVRGGTPAPNLMSDGRQGVVDPRDVAEVAVTALTDPRHAGHTYTLTGPETISAGGQAAVLGEILGRPVRLLHLTAAQRREQLLGAGLGAAYADSLTAGARFIEEGGNAVVTEDVPHVLGRPARTYREWALDHKEAFA
ncbi:MULTISPECIES: NAD(P)H-binding protein [unclassified Streptomyces]|uniref:NAD(P)H-binding protein n=1 Tax=unclassified Streptomyces TaxID=2593676 RepID=UPI0023661263|nr:MULTISPECIES: NAD(P)H-binding protein [unclassified Streptomyces]MDF3141330.1 NAD(P)H-binding protein [Streptomyces sp. T21Q-yed]WDF42404.1 NAD(P)H-binding protein [Streptomyces sp. T12]